MKKMMRRAAVVILAAAVMLTLLVGCGAETDVKKTISNFESACQALDMRGMLECINPTISKPILGAMDLLGVEDTSGTLDTIVGALGMFENAGEKTEEFVKSIEIKPSNYNFNDAEDACSVVAALNYGDGNSKAVTMKLVLKDEIWYISDIEF